MSRVLKINQGDYTLQVDDTGSIIFDTVSAQTTGDLAVGKDLDVKGNIHVTGVAYGTAPVVTNILYVTMDGKDTNDGSSQDSSRACRTIGGALKSPLYTPGTSIKVAAGHYLEQNPLVIKPYTSVIGSDLRTTSIEPINKTQDLFHVSSSCYLAQMQFINGRSGIVDPFIDRGAYAVTFPVFEKVDCYKSPYIQNCTNQSGPWLYDGTMFIPNQTVQIPKAVATTTFGEGESIITVDVSEGTIEEGMSINTAPQNIGFFSARTLILSNITFIQEQIIEYIADTYPSFIYSTEKCSRDISIILKNIMYDVTFGGNSKSVEAGLAYWNGVSSFISGETTETTAALTRINELAAAIINNADPSFTVYNLSATQYKNINLVGGSIATTSIADKINIIKNIIAAQSNAPVVYYSTGAEPGLVSAEELLLHNKSFIQAELLAWIDYSYSAYGYDVAKCERDVGFIIDAIIYDMIFSSNFNSIIAGRAYYRAAASFAITNEKTQTIAALTYLTSLIIPLIHQNPTAVASVTSNMALIKDIIQYGIQQIPAFAITTPTGKDTGFTYARDLIAENTNFIKAEVIEYIRQNHLSLYNSIDRDICSRDVGYILDALFYDLTYGGNLQSIIAGEAYFSYTTLQIAQNEVTAILAVFELIGDIVWKLNQDSYIPLQMVVPQVTNNQGSLEAANEARKLINDIRAIIDNKYKPIKVVPADTAWVDANLLKMKKILTASVNKLKVQVTDHISTTQFSYNVTSCRRDIGLIIDAVSGDALLGGNSKSIDTGLAYYFGDKLVVSVDEVPKIVGTLGRLKNIIEPILRNELITKTYRNSADQIQDISLENGYIATPAIKRNIDIIINLIENGRYAVPLRYAGTALFSATGLSADDVRIAPTVINKKAIPGSSTLFEIELSAPTVGIGNNSSLYFGETSSYPIDETLIPSLFSDRWASRKLDPWGAMGGALIDGNSVTDVSPIKSFVFDAYTQVNQGGRGVRVTNNGYCQLVSVFTIFSSIAVQADRGGIASVTNSNANFGEYCMIAKGYGVNEFSGTVYNPPILPLYPKGYYPNDANVEIFVPDAVYRPHIALIMEVEPPLTYRNAQALPGFISTYTTFSTITVGTLVLTDIDVTDMYIGQKVYIRDIYGRFVDPISNIRYIPEGTTVIDVGPHALYLSKPIGVTAGNPQITTFFTLFTSGNAYYQVLSSTLQLAAAEPQPRLRSDKTTIDNYSNVLPVEQRTIHVESLNLLKSMMVSVATNTIIGSPYQTNVTQITYPIAYPNGRIAVDRLNELNTIIIDGMTFADVEHMVGDTVMIGETPHPITITKKGTSGEGYGDAANIIDNNVEFLVEEITAFLTLTYPALVYNKTKCRRDVRLICKNIGLDLRSGGNYNSVFSGLSYWFRPGTYHVVSLENQVRDFDLFPDGALVNFYQRSYITASGYLFEYIGAGTNYGALPQIGRADPIQANEVNMLSGGKVFFTSIDQNGDFRVGPGLLISQANGTLSGRAFQKSLFAEMTPFILAIEG